MNTNNQENTPILTSFREGTGFLRSVATLVIAVFGFVMYSPSVFAIVHSETPEEKLSAKERYENSFEVKLDALDQALDNLNRKLNAEQPGKHIGSQSWFTHLERMFRRDDVVEARLAVTEAWDEKDRRHQESIQTPKDIEKRYPQLKDPKLKAQLISKVLENQRKATEKHAEYEDLINAITEAEDIKALKRAAYKATKHIANYRATQPKHIYNSGEMPFGVSSDATRSPYTVNQLAKMHQDLGLEYDPELVHADVPVNASTDYGPTTDVQITQEIRDLAASLGNDPKRIYNWVYNNIYYIPSFGSIQGSVQTLHNRAGNAFDISSLLIALLRASNIPARYVYGVAKFSADQVNNWVGGVDDIQSARVLMAQGGVPNSAVSYGGRFEELKIEHVWVESYGNFQPSGDYEWIPLDAAFKQYTFTEGMDLLSQVNFDQAAFQETVENAGIVNEAEGWISNIESGSMQTQLQQLQSDIENLIASLDPDTTLAEVIGGKSIIQRDNDAAPEPLAYETIIRSRSFSVLPDRLRHTFRVELEQPSSLGGLPLLNFEMSLPDLAGKELALSFRPATPEDEARVEELFGGANTVEELPTEIPKGYFNVVGEVTVDGEVMASTSSIEFGEQLVTHKGFDDPRFDYRKTTSPITAGDYQAIGMDFQGITTNQLVSALRNVESLTNRIERDDMLDIAGKDVVGQVLQSGMLIYFALNDLVASFMSSTKKLVHYRMPSFGTFSTRLEGSGWGGSRNHLVLGAIGMDIDWLMSNTEGRLNCLRDWISFNTLSGQMASTYEHVVPELLFSNSSESVEFISTIKAMRIANSQGQKIYTITGDNIETILPLVDADSKVKNDIELAIRSGQIAFIHEAKIEYNDYLGSGYILIDTDTGAGAYKISGGENGSINGKAFFIGLLFGVLSITLVAGGPLIFVLFALPYLFSTIVAVRSLAHSGAEQCFWAGFSAAFLALSGFALFNIVKIPAMYERVLWVVDVILASVPLFDNSQYIDCVFGDDEGL